MRHLLTADEVKKYSSTFIENALANESRDLFRIADFKQQNQDASFKAKITQQKEHPFSVGGFHLSAITATEIILLVIREKLGQSTKSLALTEHKIYCKSTVRSKEPRFNLKIETPSPNNLLVHFNIEKSSYCGSFKFSKIDSEQMGEDYALPPSQLGKFNVTKAKIEHKKLLAKLDFCSENARPIECRVTPESLLAIISQLVIIQLYSMSAATVKQSGVVLIESSISWNFEAWPSNLHGVDIEILGVRFSKSQEAHVIAEVHFSSHEKGFFGNAIYFFEPM